jgi:hypothetical protein
VMIARASLERDVPKALRNTRFEAIVSKEAFRERKLKENKMFRRTSTRTARIHFAGQKPQASRSTSLSLATPIRRS